AVPGDYKVQVQQTANYARLESSKPITQPLKGQELTGEISISDGNQFEVTIDGVKKIVTLNGGSYDNLTELAVDLENAINKAFGWQEDGIKRVDVSIEDNQLTIQPAQDFNKVPITLNSIKNEEGETIDGILQTLGFEDGSSYRPLNLHTSLKDQLADTIADGTIFFSINGHEFEFSPSSSLQLILDKINSSPETGVTARYDSLTDKLVFLSKETGIRAEIQIEDKSGLFNALGFEMIESTVDGRTVYRKSVSGQNARIVLNGTIVEKTTNDFTINGMRFNIKGQMQEGQEATFRLENDPDAAVESIKKYIELYNETIDYINGKLSEERYRKYPPLTEEQKKEMSEKEIELWEERAKSGLLRSDPLLDRIVRNLRFAVSGAVAGQPADMKSLSAIGITTKDWREKGKLHVNEEKLRNAIVKDPEAVMRLFNASGENTSQNGVATRFYEILKGGIEDITEKAGGGEFQIYDDSVLGKQIRDMEDRISTMEEMLVRTEERYWQKFIAMEQAIQYANQQSMWLASQMNMYSGY
ncbi:MAG TPA: flagellar filament capping protein FliD, partial [Thermoanaerobacterales bacterium]|nr:flagellar filament capping protein FliD [Thermoanaerobacterales bacterium]